MLRFESPILNCGTYSEAATGLTCPSHQLAGLICNLISSYQFVQSDTAFGQEYFKHCSCNLFFLCFTQDTFLRSDIGSTRRPSPSQSTWSLSIVSSVKVTISFFVVLLTPNETGDLMKFCVQLLINGITTQLRAKPWLAYD